MEACERAAHGEKAFWAEGSAGVAAPCSTDAGQPPAWVNLLVLNAGGRDLPQRLLSTPPIGAARDPSPPSLPDRELADTFSVLSPTPLGRERRVTNGKRLKDPFQEPCLAQKGVPNSPVPPDPAWPQASGWETVTGQGGGTHPLGASLGNQNRTKGAIIFIRCNPKNCRASDWILGEPTKFQPWFLPLVSYRTTDKSLPFSQSWFPYVCEPKVLD